MKQIISNCVAKISVSSETNYCHIVDVVYYRSGMSPDFVNKWRWFFEYVAAKVKVAHPKRKVELYIGPQNCMVGTEWHEYRRGVLLKSRHNKLKKLVNEFVDDDLFHFSRQDHDKKIAECKSQIYSLENDTFEFSEFPAYINKIKDYVFPS